MLNPCVAVKFGKISGGGW